jgi:phosphopantothenate synthetase
MPMTLCMVQAQVTTLSRAHDRSDSLRTTVPASIVRLLELEEGDKIEWILEPGKGKFVVKIQPFKK